MLLIEKIWTVFCGLFFISGLGIIAFGSICAHKGPDKCDLFIEGLAPIAGGIIMSIIGICCMLCCLIISLNPRHHPDIGDQRNLNP